MDANIARMWINKQAFEVLYVDFNYHQYKDVSGKPVGDIKGGIFSVTIESSSGPKYNLLTEWMLSTDIMHNGLIRFYRKDGISKMFDFEFYDGHCINYHETFFTSISFPMTTTITISCAIIRMREMVIEKKWKVSDLSAMGLAAAPEETKNDHFIKFSLVDQDGEPIPNVRMKLILPDGRQKTEISDKDGIIELKNIKPGECKILSDWKGITMDDTVIIE